ncbi:MAG: hypothetical protein A3C30_04725 [Candidatus Levybacteria bacterium RIFCSPHIGHO2_02_FULL_40_18]|nr:MAG: hypothetical protein A2869_02380 [Candidatus Levybacteria bacterium RIFCSPHIGHO2_01_FULL_40_58]OGH26383.1 MAG: hypothetical protein A3C30_04725 [Candidatus Levybacteria bacterium RIFCSPHIGHO2_02_FULL_40_18]OGH31830.1 MAG: hypothetical protein A3E43_00520 [Candidatus Levybacteria bacterium RIFCSPHIGHO2_12_FULL_40_31]OGH40463.1 MAG: hypothetical protein A2894_01025 [Candidatus Levybacteria bacterium RIFCSPLOWO2_01_FULL_40_64]OGH49170.1 MAG: hypothetical protein A3I54_04425 [Candidatus Lev
MIVLLLFAFLSGLVTIAAPCIWPLLPIILSSSILGSDHRRPLGITIGILISFGILTLTISYLVSVFRFDPSILRYIAVAVLLFLGVAMVVPLLTRIVEGWVSRFAGRFGQASGQQNPDFLHGLITGLSLGVVWTPCAGPILAAIATLAATRAVNSEIVLVTIVYLVGVGIPLFIFAWGGQRIVSKTRVFNKYTGIVQKFFGIIIILTALLIATNYDKVLQAKLLDVFPAYAKFVVDLESNDVVKKQLDLIRKDKKDDDMVGKPFSPMPVKKQNDLFNANFQAPELAGISNWLNSNKPLTLSELRGKVVLIDFWTYTCINCIRTLPHVTSWYEKYKDKGFVVIGVHTPEFEFEKKTENVEAAIKQYGINYPVPQDNDYKTWDAFNNRYWPAKYLIDKDGIVRYVHFGEGKYEETEKAIRLLLEEAGSQIKEDMSGLPDETPRARNSPETYLGSQRMKFYFPNGRLDNGTYKDLVTHSNIPTNSFTLGGDWEIMDEYSTSGQNAVLEYRFSASKVFLVMRPVGGDVEAVKVFLDGKLVDGLGSGSDPERGVVKIDSDRLYNLIDLAGNRGEYLLRLEFSPNIEIFAFTFG